MRKAVYLLPAFLLVASASAFAQKVDTSKDRTETVKVTVSGTWDLDFIFKSRELAQWRGEASGSTTEFSPETWIRLDVELSDKVSAVMELGLTALRDIGDDTVVPTFGQLYAQLADIFSEGVTLKLGQVWTDFDIRGRGSSIVFDSFWSEALSLSQSPDGRSAADYGMSAGAVLNYMRENITLQVFLLPKINDTIGSDPSPATTDDFAYGVNFFYNLDTLSKGSRVGAHFSSMGTAGADTAVMTLGVAADLYFMTDNALEVFAEVYFQFGDAGSVAGSTIDAAGMAFQVGAKYNFTGDMKPWIELKLTFLSGDDEADDENESFISREHQRDLMILEDEVFGVDWDTNYFAIKILGGLGFMPQGGVNKLWLNVAIGIATANEDVGTEDGLGNEVDVKLTYNYSKAVNLDTGIAFLFGSDIMEQTIVENDDSAMLFWVGGNARW
jgi:hypothetical protein